MRIKAFLMSLIMLMIFVLTSCSGEIIQITKPSSNISIPSSSIPTTSITEPTETTTIPSTDVEVNKYTVQLKYADNNFTNNVTNVKILFTNEYSEHFAYCDSTGLATLENVEGTFNVHISSDTVPSGYSYNPNIYKVDGENKHVDIELGRIISTGRRKGTDLYDDIIKLTNVGYYSITLNQADNIPNVDDECSVTTFFQFEFEQGKYIIESYIDVYEDVVNPTLSVYQGTPAYKTHSKDVTRGGKRLSGGFTENFLYEFDLNTDNAILPFGIYAENKNNEYPVTVYFRIMYYDEYYYVGTEAQIMVAKEIKENTPDGPSGKTLYHPVTNGILDGTNYAYNPEDGYWHVYNHETGEWGPTLYMYISTTCPYLDRTFMLIDVDNKCLSALSNGTEDYKYFIQNDYGPTANSDGVVYLTNELKEFLQKFSVSQRYFRDGDGWIETQFGVYAKEQDQWLFGVCYYV